MPYRTTNPVQKPSRKKYFIALGSNIACCLAFSAMLIWFLGYVLSNLG